MADESLHSYNVWDRQTRLFHWINLLAVLGLIGIGSVILFASDLGIPSKGKILLKETHVLVGYVFAANIAFRFIWAFIGNRYARWCAILPCGSGFLNSVRDYKKSFFSSEPKRYIGHTPPGRIAVTLLLVLLLIQAATGLVLAGTDIFYPPFGSWITSWIAPAGVDPSTLVPYAKETYDEQAYKAMRGFRKPFIITHYYVFYALLTVILVHIAAVIVTELSHGSTLISAMFTGRKTIPGTPVDKDEAEN